MTGEHDPKPCRHFQKHTAVLNLHKVALVHTLLQCLNILTLSDVRVHKLKINETVKKLLNRYLDNLQNGPPNYLHARDIRFFTEYDRVRYILRASGLLSNDRKDRHQNWVSRYDTRAHDDPSIDWMLKPTACTPSRPTAGNVFLAQTSLQSCRMNLQRKL